MYFGSTFVFALPSLSPTPHRPTTPAALLRGQRLRSGGPGKCGALGGAFWEEGEVQGAGASFFWFAFFGSSFSVLGGGSVFFCFFLVSRTWSKTHHLIHLMGQLSLDEAGRWAAGVGFWWRFGDGEEALRAVCRSYGQGHWHGVEGRISSDQILVILVILQFLLGFVAKSFHLQSVMSSHVFCWWSSWFLLQQPSKASSLSTLPVRMGEGTHPCPKQQFKVMRATFESHL